MVMVYRDNPGAIRELDHIYEYIANEKLAPENAKGAQIQKSSAQPATPTFFELHSCKNILRKYGKYLIFVVLIAFKMEQ